MKKLICLATVIFCLSTCFLPCFAASDIICTLKAEQPPKENVTLSVNISKDSSLYTTEFYIHFNPDDVEYLKNKTSVGKITEELDPYFSATEVSDGKIKISYTSTKPLNTAGELCKLEFRAKTDAFTFFNIEIEHAETFDGEIRSLTHQAVNANVTITKQSSSAITVIIVSCCAVVAVTVAVIAVKKKKSTNKSGK